MTNEIEILNEWLETQAIKFENDEFFIKYKKEHTEFENTWISYYRGLKNIHLKNGFMISSGDGIFPNPLKKYLEIHRNEYTILPYTGSCSYVRKNLTTV